ncbi:MULTISPECIES: ABC transporter ATP-binding protein [unclassified Candidatus Paralachnospira]|uniref:ABC transporter ATP-binding protein n=1 Tax=unclassified Candidatus Paralachnospira TaxID=3099471 RepID=UPI003F924457
MKLLEVNDLDLCFYSGKAGRMVHAVDTVSFSMEEGMFLGLAGESGCGKSTLARLLLGLKKPDRGRIMLDGKKVAYPFPRAVYQTIQMIFQLPSDSFDPRKTIGNSMIAMQKNFGISRQQAAKTAVSLLKRVGLEENFMNRYPGEMSGGECQRAAIARALSVQPKLLICDEVTSALDVSVQAQIVELLYGLREEYGLAMLFISHDLALVQGLCERLMIMKDGKIIEAGETKKVLNDPENSYTRHLINSVLEVS